MLLVASTVTLIVRGVQRLSNQLKNEGRAAVSAAAAPLTKDAVFRGVDLSKLVEVSTEELAERLKRSEFGTEPLKQLGDEAQAKFAELGRRYEVIGNKATELFRKRSRFWCTVVVNTDSIHILNAYVSNEGLREGVIARLDAILDRHEADLASVEESAAETAAATKEQLENAVDSTRRSSIFWPVRAFPSVGQIIHTAVTARTHPIVGNERVSRA